MSLTLTPPIAPAAATPPVLPGRQAADKTARILQTAILIEQQVEARYLRVGRAFTYGPIRRLFEEYAAEVRDHARILSRHLRDREDAKALEGAGADVVLLECIPAQLGAEITRALHVPVIGIGAGPETDGQILVLYDVLDITAGRKPKFSKNFMAGHDSALEAVKAYTQAVKTRAYPGPEHCF